jgi:hypothetical protein
MTKSSMVLLLSSRIQATLKMISSGSPSLDSQVITSQKGLMFASGTVVLLSSKSLI